jgi:hypothetical protein
LDLQELRKSLKTIFRFSKNRYSLKLVFYGDGSAGATAGTTTGCLATYRERRHNMSRTLAWARWGILIASIDVLARSCYNSRLFKPDHGL